jgi:hypothetical protein
LEESRSPDLARSKVAKIRKNIETLEKKVGGASIAASTARIGQD